MPGSYYNKKKNLFSPSPENGHGVLNLVGLAPGLVTLLVDLGDEALAALAAREHGQRERVVLHHGLDGRLAHRALRVQADDLVYLEEGDKVMRKRHSIR